MDRENTISAFEKIINVCKEDGCDFVDLSFEDAEQILALVKEQEAEIAFLKAMQLQTVHNMSNEDIGNAVRNVLRL